MKPPSQSPRSGRPPKRRRTEAELQELARALGADWTRGDTVQIWIHKHEGKTGELSRMVEAGWLWEDIGKAMHLAGITYSTGQQIPPHTLRLKAYLARNREKDRTTAEAARQGQLPTLPLTPAAVPVATTVIKAPTRPVAATPLGMSDSAGGRPPERSTFQLVTLKGGQQAPTPQPSSRNLAPESSATATVSDEEILRRVFGKS